MATMSDNTFEPELIKEFFNEYDTHFEATLKLIHQLDEKPTEKRLHHTLFRSIHSIKSNLRMLNLTTLSELLHLLENILEGIRADKFPYEIEMGKVIQLSLEEVKVASEKMLEGGHCPEELKFLKNVISQICTPDTKVRQEALKVVLDLLDPFVNSALSATPKPAAVAISVNNPSPEDKAESPNNTADTTSITAAPIVAATPIKNTAASLKFFEAVVELAAPVVALNQERLKRILSIVLAINQQAKNPVSQEQLTAAVYLHQLLAVLMPDWGSAANIILEQNERPDGTGPKGLKEDEISPGAKILAIAKAYDSIIQSHPNQKLTSRALISAIMEVNKRSGAELSTPWVDIFNTVMKQLYQAGNLH